MSTDRATVPVNLPPAADAASAEAALRNIRRQKRALHAMFNGIARFERYALHFLSKNSEVEILRDIPYGEHAVANLLDIYRPRYTPRPLPVLLYIHGGAFVLCSKDTHRSIALLNAERSGYLVVNINYRLAPNHPFPAAIGDACDAYRWTVQNIAAYGGDPARIMVAGESAGGNLALGVAVAASYKRPELYAQQVYELGVPPIGVMPLMPYLQVSNPERHRGEPGVGYFTMNVAHDIALAYLGGHESESDATLMADPIRVLEYWAPDRPFPAVFTGAGTADICCADSRRLEATCNKWGIPVTASYIDNELHAFHAFHWRAPAVAFWGDIVRFMKESLIQINDLEAARDQAPLRRFTRWVRRLPQEWRHRRELQNLNLNQLLRRAA